MRSTMSRRNFLRFAGGAAGVALLAACAPAPGAAPAAGGGAASANKGPVTVRYAGLESMGGWLEKYAAPWMKEHNIKFERASFGQQELTDKVMQSVATDTYLADMIQFESNARADVVGAKALMEVPDTVLEAIQVDDILPSVKLTMSWDGKYYALPYDGDIHYYSFRKDLFGDAEINGKFKAKYGYDLSPDNGAETWEQWRNIAEFFTGWDWNKNGKQDDYGIACMTKRGDTAWWGFHSRATAYSKHPDDPAYFFDLQTGDCRLNNPGFVKALTEWVEENEKWAPEGGTNFTYGDSLNAVNGGRAVQTYNWDAVSTAAAGDGSVIKDKQGYNILPGATEVYNTKEGKWDKFEKASHAPFHAFGGWVLAVMAKANKDNLGSIWDLATFLTKPETGLWFVTNLTGASPYRYSQFKNIDAFANSDLKLGKVVAEDYLDAAQRTMDHPNRVVDLALPGWTQYRDALELAVSKAMAKEASPQAALDEAKGAFDEISDRMGGKAKQMEIYKLVLGK